MKTTKTLPTNQEPLLKQKLAVYGLTAFSLLGGIGSSAHAEGQEMTVKGDKPVPTKEVDREMHYADQFFDAAFGKTREEVYQDFNWEALVGGLIIGSLLSVGGLTMGRLLNRIRKDNLAHNREVDEKIATLGELVQQSSRLGNFDTTPNRLIPLEDGRFQLEFPRTGSIQIQDVLDPGIAESITNGEIRNSRLFTGDGMELGQQYKYYCIGNIEVPHKKVAKSMALSIRDYYGERHQAAIDRGEPVRAVYAILRHDEYLNESGQGTPDYNSGRLFTVEKDVMQMLMRMVEKEGAVITEELRPEILPDEYTASHRVKFSQEINDWIERTETENPLQKDRCYNLLLAAKALSDEGISADGLEEELKAENHREHVSNRFGFVTQVYVPLPTNVQSVDQMEKSDREQILLALSSEDGRDELAKIFMEIVTSDLFINNESEVKEKFYELVRLLNRA